MADTTLLLDIVDTPRGLFIRLNNRNNYKNYLFNRKTPSPTFSPNWCFLDDKPLDQIIHVEYQQNINLRYRLLDETLQDRFPLEIPAQDVEIDEYRGWVGIYKFLGSLYELVSDPVPPKLGIVPWRIENCIEMPNIPPNHNFEYSIDKVKTITVGNVSHQLFDELLFPEIILPMCACKLTSKQSYDIIRFQVKQRIDYNYATITSDYDFCFTVRKVIMPKENLEDLIYPSKRIKTKKDKKFRNDRSVVVFEMTHTGANYKGYTAIEPFYGENLKHLKHNIDTYLKNLMLIINEPLVDCPHCKGTGVILKEEKENA